MYVLVALAITRFLETPPSIIFLVFYTAAYLNFTFYPCPFVSNKDAQGYRQFYFDKNYVLSLMLMKPEVLLSPIFCKHF